MRHDGWAYTKASYYSELPAGCYDKKGFHPHPKGLRWFTAHKTLPCGTKVEVEYHGKRIVVTVRDRGPYVSGRDLDLSRDAFAALAPLSRGVVAVRWRRLA